MEENIIILVNATPDKEIELKKFGIKLRKINGEEISYIVNKINELYLSENINYLVEENNIIKDIDNLNKEEIAHAREILNRIMNLPKNQKEVFFYLEELKEQGRTIDIKKIQKNLEKCLIAEVDKEKFKKCFGDLYELGIIIKLLEFSNYVNSEEQYKEVLGIKLKDLKNFQFIINEEFVKREFNYRDIEKIFDFLNNQNVDFNMSFFFVIETLLSDNITAENRIVNMVSVIERLLINEIDKKQENFVLKVGVLCYGKYGKNNEDLKEKLKKIYEIRSYIVHGNEEKIYSEKDKISRIFEYQRLNELKDKFKIRLTIFTIIETYLEEITKIVIRRYIEDSGFCEYLRMN